MVTCFFWVHHIIDCSTVWNQSHCASSIIQAHCLTLDKTQNDQRNSSSLQSQSALFRYFRYFKFLSISVEHINKTPNVSKVFSHLVTIQTDSDWLNDVLTRMLNSSIVHYKKKGPYTMVSLFDQSRYCSLHLSIDCQIVRNCPVHDFLQCLTNRWIWCSHT